MTCAFSVLLSGFSCVFDDDDDDDDNDDDDNESDKRLEVGTSLWSKSQLSEVVDLSVSCEFVLLSSWRHWWTVFSVKISSRSFPCSLSLFSPVTEWLSPFKSFLQKSERQPIHVIARKSCLFHKRRRTLQKHYPPRILTSWTQCDKAIQPSLRTSYMFVVFCSRGTASLIAPGGGGTGKSEPLTSCNLFRSSLTPHHVLTSKGNE